MLLKGLSSLSGTSLRLLSQGNLQIEQYLSGRCFARVGQGARDDTPGLSRLGLGSSLPMLSTPQRNCCNTQKSCCGCYVDRPLRYRPGRWWRRSNTLLQVTTLGQPLLAGTYAYIYGLYAIECNLATQLNPVSTPAGIEKYLAGIRAIGDFGTCTYQNVSKSHLRGELFKSSRKGYTTIGFTHTGILSLSGVWHDICPLLGHCHKRFSLKCK